MQDHVRAVSGDPTLDLASDWAGLKGAIQALISAMRNDSNLFVQSGPDAGKEVTTIEDVGGVRRAVIYSSGEMDYIVPLIDDCLIYIG